MVLEGRADLPRAVLCEQDFFKPLDFESQERMLSTYMTAEYYHSWVRSALPAPDPTLFPPNTPAYNTHDKPRPAPMQNPGSAIVQGMPWRVSFLISNALLLSPWTAFFFFFVTLKPRVE